MTAAVVVMAELASQQAAPAGTVQPGTPSSALQGRPANALDSPDFDAVKFLNEMFPTGGQLACADPRRLLTAD